MPSERYRLVIARRFVKALKHLDRPVQGRILSALEKLEEDPHQGEKVLASETGNWRLRVGDEVHILRVGHRREVYREG